MAPFPSLSSSMAGTPHAHPREQQARQPSLGGSLAGAPDRAEPAKAGVNWTNVLASPIVMMKSWSGGEKASAQVQHDFLVFLGIAIAILLVVYLLKPRARPEYHSNYNDSLQRFHPGMMPYAPQGGCLQECNALREFVQSELKK